MEEHNYRLIVAYFDKTISDDGLTQLQDWIEENPENLAQFSETIQILQASKQYFNQPLQPAKSWERISDHINAEAVPDKKSGSYKYTWMAVAATCLIVCASGLLFFKKLFYSVKPVAYTEVSNPNGKRSKLLLPDSSVIYLGGGSTIKFAKNFTGNKRTVILNGEAFFDVVHQAKRPFVVQSGEISTVVLGTSFNVKAYGADKKVSITVQSGKVGVMASVNGKQQLINYLLPNQQLEINTQSGLYTFNEADAATVSSWIKNDFNFYNTALKDIAAALEHHYGVEIEFTDPELAAIKLTAKFSNSSMVQVMDGLSELSGLAYTQKGNHLFFSNNHQKGGKIMK